MLKFPREEIGKHLLNFPGLSRNMIANEILLSREGKRRKNPKRTSQGITGGNNDEKAQVDKLLQ
jgi:hypothetical protein